MRLACDSLTEASGDWHTAGAVIDRHLFLSLSDHIVPPQQKHHHPPSTPVPFHLSRPVHCPMISEAILMVLATRERSARIHSADMGIRCCCSKLAVGVTDQWGTVYTGGVSKDTAWEAACGWRTDTPLYLFLAHWVCVWVPMKQSRTAHYRG